MSNEPKDGGPAFPVKGGILFYYPKEMEEQLRDLEEGVRAKFDGMTLRDWFAGQYLAGTRWSSGTLEAHIEDAFRAADVALDVRLRSLSA